MARTRQQPITTIGLDIGSSAIRVVVGHGSGSELQLIGAVEVSSEGMQKGQVTSIEEVVSAISNALEQVERLVGFPVEQAWVGMAGTQILSHQSRGVVAVAKTDGEIAEEDVERAIEAARMVAPPLNYEVLHVIPRHFSVDGQTGIKDPVGMTGVRLEVEAQIIYGFSAHIKNITKAVYRTGIDINDLVVSIFGTGEVVSTPTQRERGVAVVDIGGSTTSMVVYEGGEVVHTAVLPIGSEHITNDIAIGLRTSIDVAEKVKIEVGNCQTKGVTKKQMIDLSDFGSSPSENIPVLYLNEIIQARVTEILSKVDKELSEVDLSGLLPSGVIFTGGGSKIGGLVELSKDTMRLPSFLGYAMGVQSITDKVNDISFVTAIGLVRWGAQMHSGSDKKRRVFRINSTKVLEKTQKFFRSLMP